MMNLASITFNESWHPCRTRVWLFRLVLDIYLSWNFHGFGFKYKWHQLARVGLWSQLGYF